MSPWALNRLSRAISRGAVFGYPTDTIWGFGCHPQIRDSVARILEIKNRSQNKGLILLSSRLEYCFDYIDADAQQLESVRHPRARPTSWLVPASIHCPTWIRGDFPTVAIRITGHPLIETLCESLQAPIVSTSANRAGRAPARNALQMRKQFAAELDYIVTGFSAGSGRPSEIKFLHDGASVRSNH